MWRIWSHWKAHMLVETLLSDIPKDSNDIRHWYNHQYQASLRCLQDICAGWVTDVTQNHNVNNIYGLIGVIYSKYFSIQRNHGGQGIYLTFCVKFVLKTTLGKIFSQLDHNAILCFLKCNLSVFQKAKTVALGLGWVLAAVYLAYQLKPNFFAESFICVFFILRIRESKKYRTP